MVKKLNFPRKNNLPNKIICEDESGKIDVVYFNSREGYLRKIFPENEWLLISGKVNYFRDKYQITNPDYVTSLDNQAYVLQNIPKYSLTKELLKKSTDKLLIKLLKFQKLMIGQSKASKMKIIYLVGMMLYKNCTFQRIVKILNQKVLEDWP